MNITPDQARELLDGASDGPWEHGDVPGPGEDPIRATEVYQPGEPGAIAYVQPNTADVKLIAATPDLAQTIAGMRWEYTFQTRPRGLPWRSWTTQEDWFDNRNAAYRAAMNVQDEDSFNCRLVRRPVGPVEVVE